MRRGGRCQNLGKLAGLGSARGIGVPGTEARQKQRGCVRGQVVLAGGRFEGDLSGCVQASEPEHSRSVRQPEAVVGETGLRAGERVAAKFCTPQDSSKTFVVRVLDGAGS